MDVDTYGYPTLRQLPHPEKSRYIPQYDEELLGPDAIARIAKDYNNLPDPDTPDKLRYFYCNACKTTWLIGFNGIRSAADHPFHNTLFHEVSGQAKRSMIVHVDGSCSGDGATSAKSSAGIVFGPRSPHNMNHVLSTPQPTKQTAEILAATAAVRHVRRNVRPDRVKIVREEEGTHVEHRWRDNWTTPRLECHRNKWIFRLIIATSSSYLVESLCRTRRGWQLNTKIADYRDNKGAPLRNGALLVDLLEEIDILSRDGVDIM